MLRSGLRLGADGYWHFRFKLKGTLYQGSTGCPLWKDARDWLNAFKGRISKGEVGLKQCPSLKVAFAHWIQTREGKVSAGHLTRARQAVELHILPHIGQKPADQVSTEDVEILISHYLETPGKRITGSTRRTKAGANTVLLYLHAIYGHLIKQGYLAKIPWDVRPLKVQDPVRTYVPVEMADQFFAEIDRWRNLPVMLAVRFQFWAGLREAESLGLRWEWLSYDLRSYTPGLTKGKEAKPLPTEQSIRAIIWAIIWEQFDGIKPLGGLVIPAEDGHQHRPQFTKKAIARAGAELGIPALTPHSMRRSYATNLSRQGMSAHHIKEALRHKQLSTSERYVIVSREDLRDGLERLRKARG